MNSNFLDQAEFADNPEPRCPVVLLLDTSGSMEGDAIRELNQGLQEFASAIQGDPLAALRVEVALVAFGGNVRVLDLHGEQKDTSSGLPFDAQRAFVTMDNFHPPTLNAGGGTPMGEAVSRALTLLRDRKEIYKQNSLDYFRPWMFLITDGRPTDDWKPAAEQLKQEESRKGVLFYGVGVEKADLKILAEFSQSRPVVKLKGLAFGELFEWLSKSLSNIAKSRPGEQVPLPSVGWGEVDTSHS